jgi:hypothetical protein
MIKTIISTLALLLCAIQVSAQSKIERSKKELTEKSGNQYSDGAQLSKNDSNNSTDSNSFADNIFADIILNIFYYAARAVVVGDYANEKHLRNNLTDYPYRNGVQGDYTSNDGGVKNNFRLDIDNSFLYSSGDSYGNHFKAKIRPSKYFYVQTDFRHLFENNPIDNLNYKLVVSDLAIGYDRIRMDKFNFGWRLGATYVGNEVNKFGFAYGINAAYFMNTKISLCATAKWSAINSRPVNAYELEMKYHRKRGLFLFGYENLKIGTPTYNFVKLGAGFYF